MLQEDARVGEDFASKKAETEILEEEEGFLQR
jgi:hypothetical protein